MLFSLVVLQLVLVQLVLVGGKKSDHHNIFKFSFSFEYQNNFDTTVLKMGIRAVPVWKEKLTFKILFQKNLLLKSYFFSIFSKIFFAIAFLSYIIA